MKDKKKIECNKIDCEWNENSECINENEYLACLLMRRYFNKSGKNTKQE